MTLDEAIRHSESLANAHVPDTYHGMIAGYLRELKDARLKINALEKEANWLAKQLEKVKSFKHCVCDCQYEEPNLEICTKCWRNVARKRVEEQC